MDELILANFFCFKKLSKEKSDSLQNGFSQPP